MNKDDLKIILEKHRMWLNKENGGERANLSGSDLSWSNLSGSDLRGSNLSGSNLSGSDLSGSDLSGSDLSGSNLSGSNLSRSKGLESAKNLFYPIACPEKGEYTAFKKANSKIVELKIPPDAKRSSATGRKCRASKAVVVSITTLNGDPAGNEVCSDYDNRFVYRVGETVEVQNFDENRWNECAPGIHHYITREEAVRH